MTDATDAAALQAASNQRRIDHIRELAATGDPYQRCLTRYAAQLLLTALDTAHARYTEHPDQPDVAPRIGLLEALTRCLDHLDGTDTTPAGDDAPC